MHDALDALDKYNLYDPPTAPEELMGHLGRVLSALDWDYNRMRGTQPEVLRRLVSTVTAMGHANLATLAGEHTGRIARIALHDGRESND